MFDKDVATGDTSTGYGEPYSTAGPDNVFDIQNAFPVQPEPQCYFWDMLETCTPSQEQMMRNGTGIMKDFIMIGYHSYNGSTIYY